MAVQAVCQGSLSIKVILPVKMLKESRRALMRLQLNEYVSEVFQISRAKIEGDN